jgi:hypothetical protein
MLAGRCAARGDGCVETEEDWLALCLVYVLEDKGMGYHTNVETRCRHIV